MRPVATCKCVQLLGHCYERHRAHEVRYSIFDGSDGHLPGDVAEALANNYSWSGHCGPVLAYLDTEKCAYRFPLEGGTGAIWKGVAKLLPKENQRYGPKNQVMGIDKDAQVVTLQDGKKIQYDALISTLPLDIMMTWLGQKKQADVLTHRCTFLMRLSSMFVPCKHPHV